MDAGWVGSGWGTAVVTGASAGIGAATAVRLAREGFDVVLGARRPERLEEVAARCGGRALQLDVTDASSVEGFAAAVDDARVLVNNAGLGLGLDPLAEISDDKLRTMWETNVAGLVRMTRAFLPQLDASGAGHIVNVGSTSSIETYAGGGGYTATKHAVRALTETLRKELLGRPIRVTQVNPGLVETEFSLVRFEGDAARSKKPYEGMEPLVADDVADCIAWAVTRPPRVNVDEIVVRPLAQATSTMIHRTT
ncbi:MAG TPA: SDR family NAD(P)-dependent oxidoreductase [Actinomycetota bacterium]|nr:SDR family NAD(P)-dependent oxidoreductase [Actinomycetota bacterium]